MAGFLSFSAPSPSPGLSLPLFWGVTLALLAVIVLLDILVPAVVVGTLLSVPVALAALGATRRMTLAVLALCVGANVLAGVLNGLWYGLSAPDLANRAVSIVTVVLVGLLTLRAREASRRAARLQEDERQLQRERALRRLAEDMGGPLGQAEFVERAAAALQRLTGAASVEIGALDRAILRAPHARVDAPGLPERGHSPSRLGSRLPLGLLAHPAGAGNVWAGEGGAEVLGRLHRPGEGDLLLILTRPTAPLSLTAEAAGLLQPMLERTALLDDLRDGRARLAERGELLRDLVYAFSHDLRTPLLANAINMRAALRGAYGELPGPYLETLRNGLSANESLLALADQLLLVAKYESEEAQEQDAQPVNLRELTLGVLRELAPHLEERDLTLEHDLAGVRVEGWRHDLRRAVQNLLGNAVKFSPPGGTVRVTLCEQGGEARLTVQDEGPGVPATRQPRLFQRFRSGGAGGGTGLGLYLTRRIAEAHGGGVSYTRTASARSLFTLTLPLQRAGTDHG